MRDLFESRVCWHVSMAFQVACTRCFVPTTSFTYHFDAPSLFRIPSPIEEYAQNSDLFAPSDISGDRANLSVLSHYKIIFQLGFKWIFKRECDSPVFSSGVMLQNTFLGYH